MSVAPYIDMDQEDGQGLRKYRPGSKIKVVLVGKAGGVTLAKPEDPSVKGYEGASSFVLKSTRFWNRRK